MQYEIQNKAFSTKLGTFRIEYDWRMQNKVTHSTAFTQVLIYCKIADPQKKLPIEIPSYIFYEIVSKATYLITVFRIRLHKQRLGDFSMRFYNWNLKIRDILMIEYDSYFNNC